MASLVAQTVKNCLQFGRPGFNSWVGKIPWRRAWQPTPVLLPGESYGQRSLACYSPWGCKELDMTECLSTAQCNLGKNSSWNLKKIGEGKQEIKTHPLFQHPQKTMINNDFHDSVIPRDTKKLFYFFKLEIKQKIQLWRLRRSHQTELEIFFCINKYF